MKSSLLGISLATCACVGLAIAPAWAATRDRSFSLSPSSLDAQGTATEGSTIGLPKSGLSAFVITFVVPLDHAINTPIVVRVYLQTPTGVACTAATQLGAATRRRPGQLSSSTGAPNVDRIAPAGGIQATVFPSAGGTVVAKSYTVSTPLAAPFSGLRAGDGLSIRVDRVSTDAADTCTTTVFVTHVDVRYTSAAAP